MLLLRLANNLCQRNFLPDDFCREKDMKGGLVATFFCAFPPSRRWHTRVAPHALQRRFCVPSVTFLWEWNMKCVLELRLERVGRAIVLAGREAFRPRQLQCQINGNKSQDSYNQDKYHDEVNEVVFYGSWSFFK